MNTKCRGKLKGWKVRNDRSWKKLTAISFRIFSIDSFCARMRENFMCLTWMIIAPKSQNPSVDMMNVLILQFHVFFSDVVSFLAVINKTVVLSTEKTGQMDTTREPSDVLDKSTSDQVSTEKTSQMDTTGEHSDIFFVDKSKNDTVSQDHKVCSVC